MSKGPSAEGWFDRLTKDGVGNADFCKEVLETIGMSYQAYLAVRRKIFWLLVRLLVYSIDRLPDQLLVGVKSKSQTIRKMDYPARDIFLHVDSGIELGVRLHSCEKEPETIEWIETFFKQGDVYYDIGANVGAYSLVASKFLNGDLKVYAFEPGFMTFAQLYKNILVNQCQDSITPLQIALSGKTTIDVFNYNNLTPGGALHALGEPIDYKGDVFTPVLKQATLSYRMDDLIQQFHLPTPNHIKIDVDGIELDILKGAESTLRNGSVRSVLVEMLEGGEVSRGIVEFLSRMAFDVHSKHKHTVEGDTGPLSKEFNYIFQRRT